MPRYHQLELFYTAARTGAKQPAYASVKVAGPDGKAVNVMVPMRSAVIVQRAISKLWPAAPTSQAVEMAVMCVYYCQEAIESGMISFDHLPHPPGST